MANLSKIKREKMLEYLEKLKEINNDDENIRAITEIENRIADRGADILMKISVLLRRLKMPLMKRNMVLYGKNTQKKSMKCLSIIFQSL